VYFGRGDVVSDQTCLDRRAQTLRPRPSLSAAWILGVAGGVAMKSRNFESCSGLRVFLGDNILNSTSIELRTRLVDLLYSFQYLIL
jgi:hypothetical protein